MDAVGVPAVRRRRRQDVGEVWTGGVRHDAGRVTQQQWHDGGPTHQVLRELRTRAWNGGSALREINNYEKLLGSGAP